jgi:beta-glucosidase
MLLGVETPQLTQMKTQCRTLSLIACLTSLLSFRAFAADIPACKNPALSVEQRVDDLLPRLTLGEKVRQLTSVLFSRFKSTSVDEKFVELQTWARDGMGMFCMPDNWAKNPREFAEVNNRIHRLFLEQSRLGIPVFIHEEGLHGLTGPGATSFPMPMALASTWNPELVQRAFGIAGREAGLTGVNTVFAPVVDLAREQRWGRCEETYGEDPWLAGQMGKAVVTGYQGAATLKHFVGHGTPEAGLNLGPTREGACTVEDLIALPFKICVQEGRVLNVTASYTELNGVPMHANQHWLTDVLRNDWGFNGLVVSDWYGVNVISDRHLVARDHAEGARIALRAGVDLETPEQLCFPTLVSSVTNGLILLIIGRDEHLLWVKAHWP